MRSFSEVQVSEDEKNRTASALDIAADFHRFLTLGRKIVKDAIDLVLPEKPKEA